MELQDSKNYSGDIQLSGRTNMSSHAYFGLKGNEYLSQGRFSRVRLYKLKKYIPPVIGVGYRDKGTKKFVGLDGTPSLGDFYSNWIDPMKCFSVSYSLDEPPDLGSQRVNII